MEYVISFDGLENIKIVEKFLDGRCYKTMNCDDNYLGQIEVVIPYGEPGWVCSSKKEGLVDLAYIPEENLDFAIDALEEMGISGDIAIQYDSCADDTTLTEEELRWFCATVIGNKGPNKKHMYQISLYHSAKFSTMKIKEEPKEAMRIVTHEGTAKGVTEALLISCRTGEILCQLQDGIITYVAGVGNPFKNNFN